MYQEQQGTEELCPTSRKQPGDDQGGQGFFFSFLFFQEKPKARFLWENVRFGNVGKPPQVVVDVVVVFPNAYGSTKK